MIKKLSPQSIHLILSKGRDIFMLTLDVLLNCKYLCTANINYYPPSCKERPCSSFLFRFTYISYFCRIFLSTLNH